MTTDEGGVAPHWGVIHAEGVGDWMRRIVEVLGTAFALLAIAVTAVFAVEARPVRGPAPDDATIATAVLARVSGRPGLDVSAVTAEVTAGGLVLTGTVSSLFDRSEVERLASGVRGVAGVDNQLQVARVDRDDSGIEVDADRALGGLPRLRGFRISVSVQGSVITLDGDVPVARDRMDAEESVSRVRGATAIVNHLRLVPVSVSPDQLKRRVEALLGEKLIFGAVESLGVKASPEGEVTLDGAVPTPADRLRAERLVYGLRGVSSVTNHLVVRTVKPQSP
ncbi:MAG: BON domain-containing protein [Acidobacteria bacterium]|nr:BON domain-containing protein [Acidobacteriota bacterium]